MDKRHVLIIGGGVAGLSSGIYALRSGFRVTILEHNLALGGVCTAWHRGSYIVDGCIHWLTGGPFMPLYAELGIPAAVPLRTLDTWMTYRDLDRGVEIPITRDLDRVISSLIELSPSDRAELERVRNGARAMATMPLPLTPHELTGPREALRSFWEMRDTAGTLVHFRKSTADWASEHLRSEQLQRIFTSLVGPTAPAFFLLMVLGFLEEGYLSRPAGGTAAFRDALERTYRELGGEVELHATVDEILVRDERTVGVRLADGTERSSDIVISTASAPETLFRLLGGRYDAVALRERLANWKLFEPIVLASFGVELPYADAPSLSVVDGLPSVTIGGRAQEQLYVRACNDDVSFAPPGHSVVQVIMPSSYEYWATLKDRYASEKDAVADALIDRLEPCFPNLRESVRMRDVATPLTYWHTARSWRGAYEGWLPTTESFFSRMDRRVSGLSGAYLAGQWVAPGGGVPSAVLSGRQVVELICADHDHKFVAA